MYAWRTLTQHKALHKVNPELRKVQNPKTTMIKKEAVLYRRRNTEELKNATLVSGVAIH